MLLRVTKVLLFGSLLSMFACGSGEPKKYGRSDMTKAKATFKSVCVACHGENGAGDGPGSASLKPKPRAFADSDWQDSVTDEHLSQVILRGGAAVGKSAAMPANPQLKSKPKVVLALVDLVRAFKKKK